MFCFSAVPVNTNGFDVRIVKAGQVGQIPLLILTLLPSPHRKAEEFRFANKSPTPTKRGQPTDSKPFSGLAFVARAGPRGTVKKPQGHRPVLVDLPAV